MRKEKTKVALIFGGKSAEYEISLLSARNIYKALDPERYEVTPIHITKEGRWLTTSVEFLQGTSSIEINDSSSQITLVPETKSLFRNENGTFTEKNFDVVFPVLHGPYGEDGSVQGVCKIIDVPYVGSGVLGSAVGMDKDVMKRLLNEAGILNARSKTLYAYHSKVSFKEISKELGEVLFVKPANLGSSVGVSRVTNEKEFTQALQKAFQFDHKVLVEEAIVGREIECAVLGNEDPKVSVAGEVITDNSHHIFYSYEAKYLDEKGAQIVIPAIITEDELKTIQSLSLRVFQTLCCEGLARVDFFLKKDGTVLVNEINTIPGFTAISMYPKLWEASGINYSDLLDQLIQLSIERFERDSKLKTSY